MKSPARPQTILMLLTGLAASVQPAWGQSTIFVDDDAPGDLGPGDPTISDPLEDGSVDHPFDAIQEAIDLAATGDEVLIADGTYKGVGNLGFSFNGKAITVRSVNGPESCIVDMAGYSNSGLRFVNEEPPAARLEGLTIHKARNDPSGSAIYCLRSNPTFVNCIFSDSISYAFEIANGSHVTIERCRMISSNPFSRPIGGLKVFRSSVTIDQSIIHRGSEFAVFLSSNSSATIQNSCIADFRIGVVATSNSSATIAGCTVTKNDTGLHSLEGDVIVRNTILWGNIDEAVASGSVVDVRYSNIEGGLTGEGNIDVNPQFTDATEADFSLSSTSPMIDAGENNGNCGRGDASGTIRVIDDPFTVDSGVGPGPIVDLGAFEFVPPDCNANGTSDAAEIEADPSVDDNGNGIPEECEPSFVDCNGNDVLDHCEPDCNSNGVSDECDLASGTSEDCGVNGVPDECEPDCNSNSVPDDCDVLAGTSSDCDGDGILDECSIEPDCNGNSVPDNCDVLNGTSSDCNSNSVLDECDMDSDPVLDSNDDGVIDECESNPPLVAGGLHQHPKNRYISFDPNNAAKPVAFQVILPDGRIGWVGEPELVSDRWYDDQWVAELRRSLTGDGSDWVRDWSGYTDPATGENVVHITGCTIVPNETYEIRAMGGIGAFATPAIFDTVPTPTLSGTWADCVGDLDPETGLWLPSNGVTNFLDIRASIDNFQLRGMAPVTWTDVAGLTPNYTTNFADIEAVIFGFQARDYWDSIADHDSVADCVILD